MDAALAWTVVGSTAGVAGVAVAVAATVMQARAGHKTGPKVTAELGAGQLDQHGVLFVEFASGKTDVMTLPKPGEAKADVRKKSAGKKAQQSPTFSPVNAIFVRNRGGAPVTVSRCHYISDLGGLGFRFEPQPKVSARGDILPHRLEPGEDAVLLHDLVSMRVFLNGVLRDHGVDAAEFEAVLTLGDGNEVVAAPVMRFRADMTEQELAAFGGRLTRQEIASRAVFGRRITFGRRPRRPTAPDP